MESTSSNNFWQFDTAYWIKQLSTSENGLSDSLAKKILAQSQQHQKTTSGFKKDILLFIGQFKSPLMLLLIGAVILSAFLGDTSDVFIILFIVISTGLMSFFQERNASKVVEKLQSMISLKCDVLRDGVSKEIPATEVVQGDIILLNAGDMIPADCLLLESVELNVNEASLTGESYPVRKEVGILEEHTELVKRTNCLWEGTNVVSGNAKALVITTGVNTIFGSIAQSASTVVETTFEKGI
jgi:Mg2+-importing ATPase